ncbi:MAG: SRPBCC family protein [Xanthobacteraceae bacterium]
MIDPGKFAPKTVYVTYIAATPEKVWQALTDPEFTKRYFFGFAVEIEPRTGGRFRMLWPDGRVHVTGEVVDWSPPRRLAVTWLVEGMKDFGELPECVVTYDIALSGEAVKLTMAESHSWDVPRDMLKGGEMGWPKILSSLKSLLETGKPLAAANEPPPPEFMEAVKKAVAEKPWVKK